MRFSFYQALRILERHTGGALLGGDGLPRHETIRIRALDSLAFPPADLGAVIAQPNPWERPPWRYLVTATFMGLYGPASPLPTTYTELIIRPQGDEEPEDRARLRDFLDLFHHRLFSFFYRALSKYRYHLTFQTNGRDVFSGFMLALIGRGTPGMRTKRPVGALPILRYAGFLTHNPRNASGLEGLLRDFLEGTPVRVEQCTGRWLRVEDRNRLGGAFCALGADMIVGASVYDRGGKLRISVGPVGLEQFLRFLPTGRTMAQTRELVRLYLVAELEFDVEVWLRGDEVPPAKLGEGVGSMLGWTTWPATAPGPARAVVFQG
jgi:type VI secretion system protein ImpH